MKKTDEEFASTLKETFDESVDALDAATLSRLNRSRHAALAELDGSGKRWRTWMPAAGMAAAVLLAVIVLQLPRGIGGAPGVASVTDMEILLDEDSIEMFEELEFYSWMDDVQTDTDVG